MSKEDLGRLKEEEQFGKRGKRTRINSLLKELNQLSVEKSREKQDFKNPKRGLNRESFVV